MTGFFKRKGISLSPKKYFVDAMGAMALGLFASLLIGTIFNTLGTYLGVPVLNTIGGFATKASGAAIGIAVANALSAPALVLASSAAVGMAGYELGGVFLIDGVEKTVTAGPAGAFIAVLVAVELGKILSKETKIDILLTPAITIVSGVLIALFTCPYIAYFMYYIGRFINEATVMQPVLMGMIISALVGIALTLPISSAAICAMIGISGIAGGAALAGCCAQMVGFAVLSFRDNGWGGVVAQGLGTSMIQMGNIVKKPLVWLPPILTSLITGPLASAVFKLKCNGLSAGMGTCGLVGPIGAITAMGEKSAADWVGIVLICLVLPALFTAWFGAVFRRAGILKKGDLKLEI